MADSSAFGTVSNSDATFITDTDETGSLPNSIPLSGLTAITVAASDKVLVQDAGSSDALSTVTAQSIADLAAGPSTYINWTVSGGTPSINNDVNVTSITDSGVGNFTLNLTTNYASSTDLYPAGVCGDTGRNGDTVDWDGISVSAIDVITGTTAGTADLTNNSVIVFGDLV